MFAAEDPTVFVRRVAHAHMTRYMLSNAIVYEYNTCRIMLMLSVQLECYRVHV